jgi:hypothetical protein
VPVLSRFLGVSIEMYYGDHAPPHFHARYGEFTIAVDIESGAVKGDFPLRARELVLEWRALRQDELRMNWTKVRNHQAPQPIAGLE